MPKAVICRNNRAGTRRMISPKSQNFCCRRFSKEFSPAAHLFIGSSVATFLDVYFFAHFHQRFAERTAGDRANVSLGMIGSRYFVRCFGEEAINSPKGLFSGVELSYCSEGGFAWVSKPSRKYFGFSRENEFLYVIFRSGLLFPAPALNSASLCHVHAI